MEDSQDVEGNDEDNGHTGASMEMSDTSKEEDHKPALAPSSSVSSSQLFVSLLRIFPLHARFCESAHNVLLFV